MARRASKVDGNQRDVTDAFRKLGASVLFLHGVGMGCPDILVGYRGRNYLIEIKDGSKPPSERKLTQMQQDLHASWRGQVDVIESVEDVERFMARAILFERVRVPEGEELEWAKRRAKELGLP